MSRRSGEEAEKYAAVIGEVPGAYCDQCDKIAALLKSGTAGK